MRTSRKIFLATAIMNILSTTGSAEASEGVNYQCNVSDQSVLGKSITKKVILPFNEIISLDLVDGLHKVELNNYDGSLMTSLHENGFGIPLVWLNLEGRSLVANFGKPRVSIYCYKTN